MLAKSINIQDTEEHYITIHHASCPHQRQERSQNF